MFYLAALVVLAGVPIHLYWAFGGTWGLPGGAATAGLPGLHATNAVVSVLLAAGAALVFGLTRPWARRSPALVMLTPIWLGSVVCISHGLYGMVTKALYAAGAHSAVSFPEPLTAGQQNHAALLDLGVFEPWFLIQGLLLLFAGRSFARTATGRRWWTLSLVAATVLVDAFVASPISASRCRDSRADAGGPRPSQPRTQVACEALDVRAAGGEQTDLVLLAPDAY